MKLVGDQSRTFTLGMSALWIVLVAMPLLLSLLTRSSAGGLPAMGVLVWFGLLRLGRHLSPPVRVDRMLAHGNASGALALCDTALAVTGEHAWIGARRLIWLNRRTNALLRLGKPDIALAAALDALSASSDPETLANVALALLLLNRYEDALRAARLALQLTRNQSVLANGVLASVMLARRMPYEAEAQAKAGVADAKSLAFNVHPMHYALCLTAVCRAERMLGDKPVLERDLAHLSAQVKRDPFVAALANMEEVASLATDGRRAEAFNQLIHVFTRDPSYVLWYVNQIDTLPQLRPDQRFAPFEQAASREHAALATSAPDDQTVDDALARAADLGCPAPAPQQSWAALAMQVVTLTGTLLLLVWWTWTFLLLGA